MATVWACTPVHTGGNAGSAAQAVGRWGECGGSRGGPHARWRAPQGHMVRTTIARHAMQSSCGLGGGSTRWVHAASAVQRTLGTVHEKQGALAGSQRPADLVAKVNVAYRVTHDMHTHALALALALAQSPRGTSSIPSPSSAVRPKPNHRECQPGYAALPGVSMRFISHGRPLSAG